MIAVTWSILSAVPIINIYLDTNYLWSSQSKLAVISNCTSSELPPLFLADLPSHVKFFVFQIFGAYCSTDWVERHKYFDTGAQISYFGNGQSFVFTIEPEIVYHWVGKEQPVTPQSASMFQAGDKSMLMVGGGSGCALQVSKTQASFDVDFCVRLYYHQ